MTVTIFPEMEQGSDEWKEARCGLLTASEMKLIMTEAKLEAADNDKCRAHVWELLAQRITKYVEPHYVSDDMLRGKVDEVKARILYEERIAPVTEVGFITNDKWGYTIGYSPDGLVGDDGAIEVKSRRQRFQFETLAECVISKKVPKDYILQVQTGLLVSERKWIDFISYCGGVHMPIIRVYPDPKIHAAIVDCSAKFEKKIAEKKAAYFAALNSGSQLFETEREIEMEMHT